MHPKLSGRGGRVTGGRRRPRHGEPTTYARASAAPGYGCPYPASEAVPALDCHSTRSRITPAVLVDASVRAPGARDSCLGRPAVVTDDDICGFASLPEASVSGSSVGALGTRPQQALPGPVLGRSDLGVRARLARRFALRGSLGGGLTGSLLLAISGRAAHPILESCLYCAAGTRASPTAGLRSGGETARHGCRADRGFGRCDRGSLARSSLSWPGGVEQICHLADV
jgi:hypothetical protein